MEKKMFENRWATLAVLCLSLLVIVVDTTIVNVALPTLARELDTGPTGLAWVVDAYALVFAAMLLPAGSLADRYGRDRALAFGLLVFAAGSVGAALSSTAGELIAMRALMGAGAAFIMPATLSILTAVYTDPAERARAIGIWSGVSGLGIAIGPTVGGWLLEHFAWSSIFTVNLPVVAVALVAGRFLVPASRAPWRVRLDPVGAILAMAGLAALTYTVIQAPDAGWASRTTLARAGLAAVLLAGFTLWERHSEHPMLPLSLFTNARFTAGSLVGMLQFFALAGTTFLLTQIYQLVLGYSTFGAGLRALPAALAVGALAPLGALVAARIGSRLCAAAGMGLMAAGLVLFSTATSGSGYVHYLVATVVMASGMGLALAAVTNVVVSALPPAQVGIGSAASNTMRNLGTVLGVAVVGSVAASAYTDKMASEVSGPASASVGAAFAIAGHMRGAGAQQILTAAAGAFVHAADIGVLVAAVAAVLGGLLALGFLPGRPAAAESASDARRVEIAA
jgi:EmrB/QacA subfamily drug resistance transporter